MGDDAFRAAIFFLCVLSELIETPLGRVWVEGRVGVGAEKVAVVVVVLDAEVQGVDEASPSELSRLSRLSSKSRTQSPFTVDLRLFRLEIARRCFALRLALFFLRPRLGIVRGAKAVEGEATVGLGE